MAQKRNPLHRRGQRNGLCPYYSACLDEAVRKSWEYWDCRSCRHRESRDSGINDILEDNDTIPYYTIPAKIYEKVC